MSGEAFPALALDNNPWMRYFSPGSAGAEPSELSGKARSSPVSVPIVGTPPLSVGTPPPAPVLRNQLGRLTRHTSAPNRLNGPAATADRSPTLDSRRAKAEAPAPDAAQASPAPVPVSQPGPRLQKKSSNNTLLQKQKMFGARSAQSAPNLTAAMRELALTDASAAPARSIESELSQQSLYKTELCRSFEESGTCRYGTKCQFAHGKAELRPVIRHPKYKTEVCKTWQAHGSCPYGARCRFIHTEEDLAHLQQQPSPPQQHSPKRGAHSSPRASSQPVAVPEAGRTPAAPSASSSPAPRLAIFADIIGETAAQ